MPRKQEMGRATNGAGTLRKKTVTRNGKEYTFWEGRVTVGFHPGTGKQIQKSVTGKTKRDVLQKMQEIAVEVNQGTYVLPSKLTVKEWLDIWVAEYIGDVKESTAFLYSRYVEKYITPRLGSQRLEALTAPAIQAFYNGLVHGEWREKPLSPKTVKNIHGTLHKALQQAVLIGYIRSNPVSACRPPRVTKKEMHPLDEQQITAFLDAIKNHPHEYLYKIVLFTGLREGEVLGLTWDCLDFERKTLLVKQQLRREQKKGGRYYISTPKNGKTRTLTLAPSVLHLFQLQKFRQNGLRAQAGELWKDTGMIFTNDTGGYLSYRTVYDCFKRIVAKIGVPDTRFHDLRHTYATLAIKGGDDIKTVQENLGHATAAFTLDVYGHVTPGMRQASAERMEQAIQALSS